MPDLANSISYSRDPKLGVVDPRIIRGGGGGGGSAPQKGPGQTVSSPDQELARQRALYEESLNNVKGLYRGQAEGLFNPFSQQVTQGQFSSAADDAAGQARANAELIRRSFASRGMSNSGGQMSSLMGAQNRASMDLRRARTAIETNAAIQNAMSQERGRAGLAALLGPELEFRGRQEVTNEDPLTAAFARMLARGSGGGFSAGGGGGGQPAGLMMSGSGGVPGADGMPISTHMSFGPDGAYPITNPRYPQQGQKQPQQQIPEWGGRDGGGGGSVSGTGADAMLSGINQYNRMLDMSRDAQIAAAMGGGGFKPRPISQWEF